MRNLPWRVWTGTGWEKHEGHELQDEPIPSVSRKSLSDEGGDLEQGDPDSEMQRECERTPGTQCNPSTSHGDDGVSHPWFDAQTECAICLSEFAKGDRVRVLPCQHIFHLAEVDEWLIHRKKLVSTSLD